MAALEFERLVILVSSQRHLSRVLPTRSQGESGTSDRISSFDQTRTRYSVVENSRCWTPDHVANITLCGGDRLRLC